MKHNFSETIIKTNVSHAIIKDPLYTAADVLSNLAILDMILALNTVFDFNDSYLVLGNKKHNIVQAALQKELEKYYSKVFICSKSDEALGLAVGLALESHKKVVVVIDDYVLNYGKTFEALTQIKRHLPNITIVYVEDEHSFKQVNKPSVKFVNTLRTSKAYVSLKKDVKHILDRPSGKPLLSSLSWIKEGIKDVVTETTVFDQFGLEYYGVIEGVNYKENLYTFVSIKDSTVPTIVHVKTNINKLRGLKLPRYKTEDALPENYINYIDAFDTVLASYDSITLCVDITSDSQHMPQFAINYPENYYVSTGTYQFLVDFIKGLKLLNKRVVFMLDSENFKHIASLIEDQFYESNNICIILRNSGLNRLEEIPSHGVFDIGLASRFSENVYMGKDVSEATHILKYVLDQETFPLSVIRIPDAVGILEHDTGSHSWDLMNPEIEPKSVIITYGENALRIHNRVQSNDLKVWVVNAVNIFDLDFELLKKIDTLNIPICIYDLEDLHRSLYKAVSMYLSNHNIISMGLQHSYLKYGMRSLKRKFSLSIDDVIELLPK